MDLNHFVISGNVTRDLELRYLSNGTATVTFSVACNFAHYDANGAKHERTDFVPVTTFGKQAERDAKYLRKGSPVTVEGRIESWYQKDKKRGGFNFKATNVNYGGGRGADEGRQGGGNGPMSGSQGGSMGDGQDEWMRSYEEGEARSSSSAH